MRTPTLLTVLLLVGTAALARSLPCQSVPATSPSQIQTGGRAEAHVAPDRATIMVGVESRAPTAAAAGADNARRQRAIIDTLRSLGLSNEQLSTVNYSVSPEMQYPPNGGTPKVTSYRVTNSVRVDVRRLDDVAKVIDASLAKGANEISSLELYSSKADSVRRSALAEAVANARSDAEVLARAAGGSLGGLLELSTEPGDVRPYTVMAPMPRMAASVATPIQPGETTIMVTVSARWAFVGR